MQTAFRRTASYVLDVRAYSTPLDRNDRARLVWYADQLERRTKLPGRRNGVLGYTGIAVLRVLLFTFMSRKTGLTCPSYTAIQSATGLSRQAVATALARLESVGLVRIMRRLVRERRARINPFTGGGETLVVTRQASNLYSFAAAPEVATPPPEGRAMPVRPAESTVRTENPQYLSLSEIRRPASAAQSTPGRVPWWAMLRK